MALIEVSFPGGKKVDAQIKGFTIATDQPTASGGDNSAPSPFDLFLSSIATCAGIYALSFCQNKDIDTTGLKLFLDIEKNPESKLVSKVTLELNLPDGFPMKYENAIKKAIDLCAVKNHLANPPVFDLITKEFSR